MTNKKCLICGKELKNNNKFLCGDHKTKIIDKVIGVGGTLLSIAAVVITKEKFKGKK